MHHPDIKISGHALIKVGWLVKLLLVLVGDLRVYIDEVLMILLLLDPGVEQVIVALHIHLRNKLCHSVLRYICPESLHHWISCRKRIA